MSKSYERKTTHKWLDRAKRNHVLGLRTGGNNVCLYTAIAALGSSAKVESPSSVNTVSQLLIRDRLHTTHILAITPTTTEEEIDDFVNQPRKVIAKQGYRQPYEINGTLAITTPKSPDEDGHAIAILPANKFKSRDIRKTGAMGAIIDSQQDGEGDDIVHYIKPEHLKTYCNLLIAEGTEVILWGVGTMPKRRNR